MTLFRTFVAETRSQSSGLGSMALAPSTTALSNQVSSEAAEILATNLSTIRRKANEVDELKMQLGMMRLRVKALEEETRARAGPGTPASSQRPRDVPASAPPRAAGPGRNGIRKRTRSSLGDVPIEERGGLDIPMDDESDVDDAIDPQLLPDTIESTTPSSATRAMTSEIINGRRSAGEASTPIATARRAPASTTRGSLATPTPVTPSTRSRSSPRQPVMTNERGERLRKNGEVDRRAAWNRQYAAERRAAQARARASNGAEAQGPVSGGDEAEGSPAPTTRGVIGTNSAEARGDNDEGSVQSGDGEGEGRRIALRRQWDRRVREAFEKEGTVES